MKPHPTAHTTSIVSLHFLLSLHSLHSLHFLCSLCSFPVFLPCIPSLYMYSFPVFFHSFSLHALIKKYFIPFSPRKSRTIGGASQTSRGQKISGSKRRGMERTGRQQRSDSTGDGRRKEIRSGHTNESDVVSVFFFF
jgi:hypothetical protein